MVALYERPQVAGQPLTIHVELKSEYIITLDNESLEQLKQALGLDEEACPGDISDALDENEDLIEDLATGRGGQWFDSRGAEVILVDYGAVSA